MAKRTCAVDGCEHRVKSFGWCFNHWQQFTDRPACKIPECGLPANARGWCCRHYARWKVHGDPLAGGVWHTRRPPACIVPECGGKVVARGWCAKHYSRWRATGDPLGMKKKLREGEVNRRLNQDGYVRIRKYGGKDRLEHRVVMEEMLGRPIYPFENVHHRNGQRADNRPKNLELWTKPQPKGQRPEDLVAWVVEYYPDQVATTLRQRLA